MKTNDITEDDRKLTKDNVLKRLEGGILFYKHAIPGLIHRETKCPNVLTPVTNVTTKRNILIPPFCIVNLLRDSKGGVFS